MGKIFGLDLGSNSIAWAIIDSDSMTLLKYGNTTYSRTIKRQMQRVERRISAREKRQLENSKSFWKLALTKNHPIILGLAAFSAITFLLSFFNIINWQFWLNTSLTAVLTMLTLIHSDRSKEE